MYLIEYLGLRGVGAAARCTLLRNSFSRLKALLLR